MRTRADIYGQDVVELLREISMYPGLSAEQLCLLHPGKGERVGSLLAYLERQGRAARDVSGGYFPYGGKARSPDGGLVRAVWVLVDFIDRVEFHLPSDFPVKIVFFSGGVQYEVVHVAGGQEVLVAQALRQCGEGIGRRIVLVDDPVQIPLIDFPGISGFCTVDLSGQVSYYRRAQ